MKFVALISSGIDSPVAVYLLSKKANEIILLYVDNHPFTDDCETEKFLALAKHLKNIIFSHISVVIIPHGHTLRVYKTSCENKFTCVFCKRMMLRYAETIVKKENAEAIIMGDSLGQVASQTLQNIRIVEQVVNVPILRPLIGFDKEDTIRIAKKIGTFDISISKAGGCRAVPIKPSTQARLEQILVEEQKIDINGLVDYAISQSNRIKL